MLESQAYCVNKRLEGKIASRKAADEDFRWLLQRGIVRVVDKDVESTEFALGVKQMKMACSCRCGEWKADFSSYFRLGEMDIRGLH